MSIEEIIRTLEEQPALRAFMQEAVNATPEQRRRLMKEFNLAGRTEE